MEGTREEELLVLQEVLGQQKEVQDEPSNPSPNPSPTHPKAKTLPQNFCQSIMEPLLKAPNSELIDFEEVVRSMLTKSPTFIIPNSTGKGKKRVSRFKRDLFSWLILFQPELKEEEEVIA